MALDPAGLDPLRIRKVLGRMDWMPAIPFGPEGFSLRTKAGPPHSVVIVTAMDWEDGHEWWHASISHPNVVPSYHDLTVLHFAVFGLGRYAYQVFAPSESHINIHSTTLHLWGRADGTNALPDFGKEGTI